MFLRIQQIFLPHFFVFAQTRFPGFSDFFFCYYSSRCFENWDRQVHFCFTIFFSLIKIFIIKRFEMAYEVFSTFLGRVAAGRLTFTFICKKILLIGMKPFQSVLRWLFPMIMTIRKKLQFQRKYWVRVHFSYYLFIS